MVAAQQALGLVVVNMFAKVSFFGFAVCLLYAGMCRTISKLGHLISKWYKRLTTMCATRYTIDVGKIINLTWKRMYLLVCYSFLKNCSSFPTCDTWSVGYAILCMYLLILNLVWLQGVWRNGLVYDPRQASEESTGVSGLEHLLWIENDHLVT